jgi:hypothetical protein
MYFACRKIFYGKCAELNIGRADPFLSNLLAPLSHLLLGVGRLGLAEQPHHATLLPALIHSL